jgi:hypothetical protein
MSFPSAYLPSVYLPELHFPEAIGARKPIAERRWSMLRVFNQSERALVHI